MYALRSCGAQVITRESDDHGCNSRRSGKRDDVVAKRSNPCNAKLGEGDALTIRDGRQGVHESQVMPDILGAALSTRKARARKRTYIILETAEIAPGITLFQIQTVLDMASK